MSEPRNLTLERVNRLSQAVADLMESHAAQGRMIARLLEQMSELLRLNARALVLERGPGVLTEAQKLLEESLAVARSQKARSLELRAAADLARLHRGQGCLAEARNLLAPVYGWFTEGFDTQDLKEAKALLDSLDA